MKIPPKLQFVLDHKKKRVQKTHIIKNIESVRQMSARNKDNIWWNSNKIDKHFEGIHASKQAMLKK